MTDMGRVWKWRSISLKVATWEKMWQIIIHRKVYLPSHLNRIISVSTGLLFYKFPQKLFIKKGIKGVTTKQPCKQIVKITRNNNKKKSRKKRHNYSSL